VEAATNRYARVGGRTTQASASGVTDPGRRERRLLVRAHYWKKKDTFLTAD
jgi:hypothetical protein